MFVWMMAVALIVAACGGDGDAIANADLDAGSDGEPVAETGGDGDGSAAGSGDDSAAADDGTSESAVDFGPVLEPVVSIPSPDAAPTTSRVAVSPTGDRFAVKWSDTSGMPNLAVYDAETGNEIVSSNDDHIERELFWTSDDRLITADNFGRLWEFDSATLQFVSELVVPRSEVGCSGGNGTVFDAVAGALFLQSDGLCRIDTKTGGLAEYIPESPTGLLAVAIGGNEVYMEGTDTAGDRVLVVLDATTLEVISSEPASLPKPISAASGNGVIEHGDPGAGYVIQPSGRVVDFNFSRARSSAGGGYYTAPLVGGAVRVVSSSDGGNIGGTNRGLVAYTAWSADDTTFVTMTEEAVAVHRIG